jgi:hypothetical protein
MKKHLSLTLPDSRRGDCYERVSTEPLPPKIPGTEKSLSPYTDAINKGDFNYYPRGIYDKEPLYLPRYTPSLVWNIVRPIEGPYDKDGDPSVYTMKTGGTLPPRFSRYVPPDFAPGPLGPHPGLTYVECNQQPRAVRQPPNMAPARYYEPTALV